MFYMYVYTLTLTCTHNKIYMQVLPGSLTFSEKSIILHADIYLCVYTLTHYICNIHAHSNMYASASWLSHIL